jgi:hypothetical protein
VKQRYQRRRLPVGIAPLQETSMDIEKNRPASLGSIACGNPDVQLKAVFIDLGGIKWGAARRLSTL